MKRVELYGQVRRAVYVEGMSRREAARRFGIDPRTVAKIAESRPQLFTSVARPAAFSAIAWRYLDHDSFSETYLGQRRIERAMEMAQRHLETPELEELVG